MVNGVQGETAEIITKHNIGLNFEPENADELFHSISRLASTVTYTASYPEIANSVRLLLQAEACKKMLKLLQSIPNAENG